MEIKEKIKGMRFTKDRMVSTKYKLLQFQRPHFGFLAVSSANLTTHSGRNLKKICSGGYYMSNLSSNIIQSMPCFDVALKSGAE
jgi:hypothetical protein